VYTTVGLVQAKKTASDGTGGYMRASDPKRDYGTVQQIHNCSLCVGGVFDSVSRVISLFARSSPQFSELPPTACALFCYRSDDRRVPIRTTSKLFREFLENSMIFCTANLQPRRQKYSQITATQEAF